MAPKIKKPAKGVVRKRVQSARETKEAAKPRAPTGRLKKVSKPKLKPK